MHRAPRANGYRDAWAGDLDAARAGSAARVAGWVHRRRDHGGLIFVDLRDRSGLVQLVFHPDQPEAFAIAERLRPEHVLSASGEVVRRAPENVNPNIPTGEIEVRVADVTPLAESETPPFPIDEDAPVDEMLRLRHRMLDLRRDGMRDALILRDAVIRTMRETLAAEDFLEIETPILTRSTPEGARDFLVPNRRDPGTWYALPQSPQLFKQLLMMSGYERYYQIARCFRDEDTRADRQAEFTQLDVEMAFVEEDDVLDVMERLMARVFEVAGVDMPAPPWERLPFDEAMARFGTDRPDRRFGLEIVDVGDALRGSDFKVFESVLGAGGVVRAINAGAREHVALRARRAQRGRPAPRWQGGRVGDGRGVRRVALADREVPRARAARARRASCWAPRPATSCCSSPTSAMSAATALGGAAARAGPALRPRPGGRPTTCTGSSTSRCSSATEEGWTAMHHPFTAPTGSFDDPGAHALARLRPRHRRLGAGRRLDPHQHPRACSARCSRSSG